MYRTAPPTPSSGFPGSWRDLLKAHGFPLHRKIQETPGAEDCQDTNL